MNPNTYLRSYWRKKYKNQVFVAMSFEERFNKRFENVIKPSIEDAPINGISLKAYRVDISRSGDSILSEIADGIAHSYLTQVATYQRKLRLQASTNRATLSSKPLAETA